MSEVGSVTGDGDDIGNATIDEQHDSDELSKHGCPTIASMSLLLWAPWPEVAQVR